MARNWTKIGGFLALGLVVGTGLLGGCGVNEKDFNALKQENEDLRAKIATTDTANQANAARVAELERQNQVSATDQGGGTAGPRSKGRSGGTSSQSDVVLEIAGDVLFDPGQATVKSTAKKELDKIVAQLNGKYSGHSVRVEGHTDSDPPKKTKNKYPTNEALSEARAQAVRDYLASKGVPARQLSVVGYGASKPKGSKKESRRVDIVVLGN